MRQDKPNIADLLSGKLRPVRKSPHLRLVNGNDSPEVNCAPDAADLSPEHQEIVHANAISAETCREDIGFAAQVGKLTRLDVLCAVQPLQKKEKGKGKK